MGTVGCGVILVIEDDEHVDKWPLICFNCKVGTDEPEAADPCEDSSDGNHDFRSYRVYAGLGCFYWELPIEDDEDLLASCESCFAVGDRYAEVARELTRAEYDGIRAKTLKFQISVVPVTESDVARSTPGDDRTQAPRAN